MNRTKAILFLTCLLLVLPAARAQDPAAGCPTAEFRSGLYTNYEVGFSLRAPAGWKEVPGPAGAGLGAAGQALEEAATARASRFVFAAADKPGAAGGARLAVLVTNLDQASYMRIPEDYLSVLAEALIKQGFERRGLAWRSIVGVQEFAGEQFAGSDTRTQDYPAVAVTLVGRQALAFLFLAPSAEQARRLADSVEGFALVEPRRGCRPAADAVTQQEARVCGGMVYNPAPAFTYRFPRAWVDRGPRARPELFAASQMLVPTPDDAQLHVTLLPVTWSRADEFLDQLVANPPPGAKPQGRIPEQTFGKQKFQGQRFTQAVSNPWGAATSVAEIVYVTAVEGRLVAFFFTAPFPQEVERLARSLESFAPGLPRAPCPASPRPALLLPQQGEELVLERVAPVVEGKAARVSGPVLLSVLVDAEGRVISAHVLSGNPLHVQPALEAMARWRFRPYSVNGRAVEFQTQITIFVGEGKGKKD